MANETEDDGKLYICGVCGYGYPGSKEEFEALPDDYVCPVCGVGKDNFEYK